MKLKIDQSQIDFIKEKVKELGSMKEVKKLYKFWSDRKCEVDWFAVRYARKIGFEDKTKKVLKRR